MDNVTFRTARLSDAEKLVEIYRPYVEDTAITFEYDVPSVEEFRQRMENTLKRYPYIVAVVDGEVSGYAYVSPFVGRAAYDWSVETSIYLDKNIHGNGVGRKIYETLEEILRRMNIINLNACIGVPKEPDEHLTNNSVEFHSHLGYKFVGEFHDCGYKFDTWYDMAWMEKMISSHPEKPEAVKNFNEIRPSLIGSILAD